MIPSQAAAGVMPGGDYWMINRTPGSYGNMILTSTSSVIRTKMGSAYETYTPSGSVTSSKSLLGSSDGLPYDFYTSQIGKDGYLYSATYSYSSNSFLLIKMDIPTGQIIWQKEVYKPTTGTGPYGYPWQPNGPLGFCSFDADSSGNVYLIFGLSEFNQNGIATINGSLQQQAEHTIIMKLNSSGVLQWSKLISANSLGTAWNCHPGSVMVDSDGYVQITTYYDPPAWTGWNSGILRFDPNGNLLWQKKIYGPYSTGFYRFGSGFNVSTNLNTFYGSSPTVTNSSTPVAPAVLVINNSGTVLQQKMYSLSSGRTFGWYAYLYPNHTISGNKLSLIMWGYPASDASSCWYMEIDFTSSTTSNTIGSQFTIKDSTASGTYLPTEGTAARVIYDSVKNKNYIYMSLISSGALLFKLSDDSSFFNKNRKFRIPGTTTTMAVTPNGENFSAISDSTVSSLFQITSGILNIYNAPTIPVQAPTVFSITNTSGFVNNPNTANYRKDRRS